MKVKLLSSAQTPGTAAQQAPLSIALPFSRASACLYMHLIPPWCLGGKKTTKLSLLAPVSVGYLIQDAWITWEGDVMEKGKNHTIPKNKLKMD